MKMPVVYAFELIFKYCLVGTPLFHVLLFAFCPRFPNPAAPVAAQSPTNQRHPVVLTAVLLYATLIPCSTLAAPPKRGGAFEL